MTTPLRSTDAVTLIFVGMPTTTLQRTSVCTDCSPVTEVAPVQLQPAQKHSGVCCEWQQEMPPGTLPLGTALLPTEHPLQLSSLQPLDDFISK